MDGRLLRKFTSLYMVYMLASTLVTAGSVKKGICITRKEFFCEDFDALTNIAWWYDWTPIATKIRDIHGCLDFDRYLETHVPMVWGTIGAFPNYDIVDVAQYLLGFNEPNHAAQANLTPEQAVTAWPELERIASERGLTLVSPAAAPCGKDDCHGNAFEWFDEFFRLCDELNGGCRVDHIATHVYKCTVDGVMNYLDQIYGNYGKPVWVTEFACPYETNATKQLEFMSELLPRFEETEYIYRYAWYKLRQENETEFISNAINLMEVDSSTLTPLGQFYNDFGEDLTTTKSAPVFTTPTDSSPSVLNTSNFYILLMVFTYTILLCFDQMKFATF